MEDNRRGFHYPHVVNAEKGGSGQGRMEPNVQGRAGMKEPTVHGGHTHERARRAESDARINAIRNAHSGVGQKDHERILHETHKLHQSDGDGYSSHGNKHGASHHLREGGGE
jgi:hypothetical protein